jgi:uncharacterized membrane protein YdjX (TVP38/TMEM64 family)
MIAPFILRGLVIMAILVTGGYLLGDLLDLHWIDRYVRDNGLAGELLFVAAGALLVCTGLSRQVVAFLGGYGFGFAEGTLLSMLATVGGCMLTFYAARLLIGVSASSRFSVRIREIDHFIHENTFSMTLLIRLLPLGSNWLVNLAAGVSGVRSAPFFLGSALGYIPQMAVFALVGSGAHMERFWQVALAMGMFAGAAVLGFYLYRKYRHGKALDSYMGRQPVVQE